MIDIITGMGKERKHLRDISEKIRHAIEEITGKNNPSRSQIIPLMTGDAGKAIELAGRLRDAGFDCLPIRRPTVAAGSERVRLSLNAGLTHADADRLIDTLRTLLI